MDGRCSMRGVLGTALCDLLGIEHPVIQSGMGNVAGPDLVAEVSPAGGFESWRVSTCRRTSCGIESARYAP
jgi:NAD(P)H-dependent flavin oxidoreductase YrpB (nitropropane dioxygenase family)